MKKPLILLMLTLLAVLSLLAEPPQQPSQAAKGPPHENRMLQHLLKMESAELVKLRQTIERIEAMTPEEKALLSERIGQLGKMKPERVEAMRQRFEAIPKETREAMRERWLEMTPDERLDWRKKLRNMSREERAKVFETHGFLPQPGKKAKGERPPPAPEAE